MDKLKHWPVEHLPFASIDHHRGLRQGYPEVIFCEGKEVSQVVSIVTRMADAGENILATRAAPEVFSAVREAFPEAVYNKLARVITVTRHKIRATGGRVLVLTAGTSDIQVAEEAVETLRALGSDPLLLFQEQGRDLHVAALREHRLHVAGHRRDSCLGRRARDARA